MIPGLAIADEVIGLNGRRCGLRFEKSLDVFFKNRVVWWLIEQLCANGWQLVSVDAGTRYFVRLRSDPDK